MNRTDGQSPARGWTADDSTFGARLALIRQHEGWGNVREAALDCGIPPETWRTWERDNVLPRNYADVCRRISEATGADYFWLLTGTQPSQSPPQVTPSFQAPAEADPRQPSADECRPIVTKPRPQRPKAARTVNTSTVAA